MGTCLCFPFGATNVAVATQAVAVWREAKAIEARDVCSRLSTVALAGLQEQTSGAVD